MPEPPWHIITGEYPPAVGGVADYSRSVARSLAIAGDEVHVWTPSVRGGLVQDDGVHLHSLPRGFDPLALHGLSREFERCPRPRRVLLQYVPQAFGMRGMNVPFCAWIASLRETEVCVMFHEVMVLWERPRTLKRAALAAATRAMAALLVTRADRIFMSGSSWEPLLRSAALRPFRATWLPIPSNVATEVPPGARQRIRERLRLEAADPVIGHFGTYGALIAPLLKSAARSVLRADSRRRLLLLGRGSEAFARELAGEESELSFRDRVTATGELDAQEAAAHLSACDVLIQPYADGISTRRTSAMAGLALGLPLATNDGWLTETVWRESGAVELAADPDRVHAAAEALLRNPVHAGAVADRGRALYRARFSMEHTVQLLRDSPGQAARTVP